MGFVKRLDKSREAYAARDKDAGARAHDPAYIARVVEDSDDIHGGGEYRYLGDVVYGGLDGIITTFAIVSGVAGAHMGTGAILIMGIANLLADGISMATGAYISSKSEQQSYAEERQREAWEREHFPEGEKTELYEIYQKRGYSEEDARELVDILFRNSELWLDTMMSEELDMHSDDKRPLYAGLVTLVAFVAAGAVPLSIYLLGLVVTLPGGWSYPISITLSALALFGLGSLRVRVTRRPPLRSGLEMLLIGGLAAGVAYVVGSLLQGLR